MLLQRFPALMPHAIFGLLTLAVLASGCSTSETMLAQDPGQGSPKMFPISAEDADRILATAMSAEFAGSPISRVEFPNKGYQATIRFALDSHNIVGYMISAVGTNSAGEKVEGFYFEVSSHGTMPISGSSRAQSVYARLLRDAGTIASPLPLAVGGQRQA